MQRQQETEKRQQEPQEQYHPYSDKRQLLVCAATNKAISVILIRYFALVMKQRQQQDWRPPNVVLVGDESKLLDEVESSHSVLSSDDIHRLRFCHVYRFKTRIMLELSEMALFIKKGKLSSEAVDRARALQAEIVARLVGLPEEHKALLERLCRGLEDACSGTTSTTTKEEDVEKLIADAQSMIRALPPDAVRLDLMKSADVIFCTLCSAGSKILQWVGGRDDDSDASTTDLIVDEAAAATEPALYIPIFQCKPSRMMLVGDPKQLPSTVLSPRAKRFGLDRSVQERLMFGGGDGARWKYQMLSVQYRMHPEISQFPSRRFYGNQLGDGECVRLRRNMAPLMQGQPYCFLQVNGQEKEGVGGSTYNLEEADAVVRLIQQLERVYDHKRWKSPDRLRIISFYQAQVTLIRRCLKETGLEGVVVSTVDSAQGCEADLVIISFVKGGRAGFLNDNRRINVALTRARHQLICVGNVSQFPAMYNADTLKDLARDASFRGAVSTTMATAQSSAITLLQQGNQADANKSLVTV